MSTNRLDIGVSRTLPERKSTSCYAIYCLSLLCIANLLDQGDRWALPTLQSAGLQCLSCGEPEDSFYEKCKEMCLDIDDIEMGFLTGPAFSITMTVSILIWGYFSDRCNRIYILTLGLVIWSAATCLSATINHFWELSILRMSLGVGQAAVNPTAFTLITDLFPPEKRAFYLAIFSMMIYTGQVFGLMTGIISESHNWRIAFLALGIPGVLLAFPLILSFNEPQRGGTETLRSAISKSKHSYHSTHKSLSYTPGLGASNLSVQGMLRSRHSTSVPLVTQLRSLLTPEFIALWISALLRFFSGYGIGAWIQTFYKRAHGLSPTTIVYSMSIIVPVGGVCGAYIGAIIADFWYKRDPAGRIWLVTLCSILAAPLMAIVLLCKSYKWSFVALTAEYFFSEMWMGPAVATVQDLSPVNSRSIASALFIVAGGFGGLSPVLIGFLNNKLNVSEEEDDPTYSMLIVVVGFYVLSSIAFALCGVFIRLRPITKIDMESDHDHLLSTG